jgi:two-component system, sensor histidine kinase and response regulator
VLLVEDNEVNQFVGQRFLERMGCTVTVARDGRAGVDTWATGNFNLILMDVHMPNMDGIAATQEIRSRENGRRVPIYALTASALSNEVERCLEAGMDGLLTKPLEPAKLREVLEKVGLAATPELLAQARAPKPAEPERTAPLDLRTLRAIADDDPLFVADLARTFAVGAEEIARDLSQALAAGDRPQLTALAHKLKGSSLSVGATEVARLSAQVERESRNQPFDALKTLIETLHAAVEECVTYMHEHVLATHSSDSRDARNVG